MAPRLKEGAEKKASSLTLAAMRSATVPQLPQLHRQWIRRARGLVCRPFTPRLYNILHQGRICKFLFSIFLSVFFPGLMT